MRQRLSQRAYVVSGAFTTTLLVATLATVTVGRAEAQESSPQPATPRERALDLFVQAEAAYEAGEVERAVALLVEARSIVDEPVLLFNLARAHETLGHIDEALDAYRRYLEEEPSAPDRRAIETRIAALERQVAERERLRQEREEAEARARVAPPSTPSPVPWVAASVGVAAVGTGFVFGVLALDARGDADADPVHESAAATFARGEDYAVVANVLFVAGGAIAAGGLVWGVVDVASSSSASSDEERATVEVSLGPGSAWLRGRF